MKVFPIFVIISATVLVSSAKLDEEFFKLQRNVPGYLPSEVIEETVSAAKARYYEDFVPIMEKLNSLQSNSYALDKLSLYANENNGSNCYKSLIKTYLALYAGEQWAVQAADSQGRLESGVLRGNYLWLGNYYECIAVDSGDGVRGQYYLSIYGGSPDPTSGTFVGICMPDECTVEEVIKVLKIGQPNTTYINPIPVANKVEYTAVDIVAIVIFSLLAGLVAVGTSYDVLTGASGAITGSGRILSCFSIVKNTRALLDTTRKDGNISALDGIRFFSMAWVILGHNAYMSLGAIDNLSDLADHVITKGSSLAIVNATVSVDSFFFLSGLLVAYLGLRQMKKRRGKIVRFIPLMYLQRYLRLTPTMALTMLFSVSLLFLIGRGPLFAFRTESFLTTCQKYWWTNLLYINNLYPKEFGSGCISWCWYLANDMQFFLLSPIFLYLLYHSTKVGIFSLGFVVVGSTAITGALANYYELLPDPLVYGLLSRIYLLIFSPPAAVEIPSQADGFLAVEQTTTLAPTKEKNDYFDDVYAKPWCRIGVYMIGMFTGYVLYATNRKIKMNKSFVIIMWLVVAAVELTFLYGMWENVRDFEFPSNDVSALYIALLRPCWGFGLMWVVIACACGYGGFINSFMSWKAFMPLSRLTFCAYLIHPVVLQVIFYSREIELHFKVNIFIYYYFAELVLSYSCAYLLSMLIEAPVAQLQKLAFSSDSGKHGVSKRTALDQEPPISDELDSRKTDGKIGIENHIELEEDIISTKEE